MLDSAKPAIKGLATCSTHLEPHTQSVGRGGAGAGCGPGGSECAGQLVYLHVGLVAWSELQAGWPIAVEPSSSRASITGAAMAAARRRAATRARPRPLALANAATMAATTPWPSASATDGVRSAAATSAEGGPLAKLWCDAPRTAPKNTRRAVRAPRKRWRSAAKCDTRATPSRSPQSSSSGTPERTASREAAAGEAPIVTRPRAQRRGELASAASAAAAPSCECAMQSSGPARSSPSASTTAARSGS